MFSGLRPHHLEGALKLLISSGYQIVPLPGHGETEPERKVHAFKTAAVMLYGLSPDQFADGQPWAEMAKIVEKDGFLTRVPQGASTDLASSALCAMQCAAVIYRGR